MFLYFINSPLIFPHPRKKNQRLPDSATGLLILLTPSHKHFSIQVSRNSLYPKFSELNPRAHAHTEVDPDGPVRETNFPTKQRPSTIVADTQVVGEMGMSGVAVVVEGLFASGRTPENLDRKERKCGLR